MDVVQQILKYYVTGHTAEGFVNYLSTNLIGIHKIVILQHPSNTLKTKVLNELLHVHQQEKIEMICSPQDKNYVDGVIIRNLSLAVLTDHLSERANLQAQTISLDDYLTESKQNLNQHYLKEIARLQEKAYAHFKSGLMIHDQLEEIYINEMDFDEADKIAEDFIESLFNNVPPLKKQSKVYKRLFGTNTPDGIVNHVEQLIEPIGRRYFIKGRAGTGKSFFMNKVLKACTERGVDVELYHCSFDPNSIDMLIMRELDVCLFDSTPPHEFFPSRDTDEIIDFYEKTVTPGTDEKYADTIKHLTNSYKTEMRIGIEKLRATKLLEENKELTWQGVLDADIRKIVQEIIEKK